MTDPISMAWWRKVESRSIINCFVISSFSNRTPTGDRNLGSDVILVSVLQVMETNLRRASDIGLGMFCLLMDQEYSCTWTLSSTGNKGTVQCGLPCTEKISML